MEFNDIYEQYGDKIYRICLGFVNDADKAKDLTQETFIAVWQNLHSYRKEAAIGTWIYRIATNKCLRSIANDKKKLTADIPLQTAEIIPDEKQDEKLVHLRKYVAELPEIDRILITLFMEDVPQEKIAEITGFTHANVRVRVHRIKERLLKKFNRDGKFY